MYDLTVLFSDSLQETELLLHQPLKFISTTFDSDYQNKYGGLLTTGSYWNDISTTLLTKLLGIGNVLSFKNLYINILLYNYLIFYGHIALYRAFCTVWPNGKTGALIGCFFIPSSIFYLSGVNKDSMFFLGMCLIIYAISTGLFLKRNTTSTSAILLLFIGLSLTFLIRNFFFLLLLPALAAYYISMKVTIKAWMIFAGIYIAGGIVFFCSPTLLQLVCNRQGQFIQMVWAKSYIATTPLEPNFKSFISHFPTAFDIAFCRPYLWNSYNILYLAGGIEVLVLAAIVVYSIIKTVVQKLDTFKNPLVLFCLFVSLSTMIFIGYTIPILGAATRYRTAYLPLLITPFLCAMPWKKIFAPLQRYCSF